MLADRLVVLERGAVQQADSPDAVYGAPANVAAARALGAPPMNLIHGTLKQERDGFRFLESGDGSIELRLALAAESGAREFAGKPVVLGIRPEDIAIADAAKEQGNSALNFPAVAEVIEPLGAETILRLQTGAHAIACRTDAVISRDETGRRMRFRIDEGRVHFFDPTSTLRLV